MVTIMTRMASSRTLGAVTTRCVVHKCTRMCTCNVGRGAAGYWRPKPCARDCRQNVPSGGFSEGAAKAQQACSKRGAASAERGRGRRGTRSNFAPHPGKGLDEHGRHGRTDGDGRHGRRANDNGPLQMKCRPLILHSVLGQVTNTRRQHGRQATQFEFRSVTGNKHFTSAGSRKPQNPERALAGSQFRRGPPKRSPRHKSYSLTHSPHTRQRTGRDGSAPASVNTSTECSLISRVTPLC